MSMLFGPDSTRTSSVSLRLWAGAGEGRARSKLRTMATALIVALMTRPPLVANRLPLRWDREFACFGGIERALLARRPCTPQTLPDFEAGTYHEGTVGATIRAVR